ncbi:MAG: putative Ig domain-containing protein [Candidatus Thiodiazotropha sp.]
MSGEPAVSVDEGATYVFSPSSSDPEGDSLNFTIVNCPNWASFDSQSGTLSGTPDYSAAGSYDNIQISVDDGELSAALPSFSIAVNDVSQDPVDPTPDPVTGPPTMLSATINGDSVDLTWTPQENDVPDGGYDIILDGYDTNTTYRTTATSTSIDGLDLSQSHCFAVQARYVSTNEFYDSVALCTTAMASPNQPPEISGSPQTTVQVGEAYTFTPASSDADGDTLSFTAVNLPTWASFDNQSGTLSGTPDTQDVGSYSGIEILVSDGEASTSLTPFTLVVEATQSTPPSTTLTWTAPSTRSDGTPISLSEISGYRIYVGDTETSMTAVVDINDHTVTEYTLTDLSAGDHYFSITAYDIDGNESGLSNVIFLSTL